MKNKIRNASHKNMILLNHAKIINDVSNPTDLYNNTIYKYNIPIY